MPQEAKPPTGKRLEKHLVLTLAQNAPSSGIDALWSGAIAGRISTQRLMFLEVDHALTFKCSNGSVYATSHPTF